MAWIAAPLMISQLTLSIIGLSYEPQSIAAIRHLTLVLSSWIITFTVSVRLHNKLQTHGKHQPTINSLVSTNWIRTAIWTTTFGLSLYEALNT